MTQIEAFLAVVRYRNLSRASKALYISHSTLIKKLKHMEQVLEFPLYTRGKQGIELTKEGAYLALHLTAVCEEYQKAVEYAKNIHTSIKQTMQFVVPSAFDADENFEMTAEIIREFGRAHPEILINMVLDSYSDLRQAVRMRTFDIAFAPDFVLSGLTGIETRPISNMKQYIAMSTKLQSARKKELDFKQLEDKVFYRILISDIDHERQMFFEECERYGFRPKQVDFINDFQTFMHNIKEGLGVSICGRVKNYDENVNIKYYPLPDSDDPPKVVAAFCGEQRTTAVQLFLDFYERYEEEQKESASAP